jgi:hypothetical protein
MFIHPLLRKSLVLLISALLVIAANLTAAPVVPLSAVSRKIHGTTPFDVPLPLSGIAGIECRSGGTSNNHQIVLIFPNPVTVASANLTTGVGNVTDYSVSASTVTLNLSGVVNAQEITVTLLEVSDGTTSNAVLVPMSVLLGDTNGNRSVNAADKSQTQGQSGQPVGVSNFRTDVTVNNVINASDKGVVQAQSGAALNMVDTDGDGVPDYRDG